MKCKNTFLLLLFLAIGYGHLNGQVPDSLQVPETLSTVTDSLPDEVAKEPVNIAPVPVLTNKKGVFKKIFDKADYPNPKKALYLSLALPGAGQVYNKRYWKLPFVYGGYVLLFIALDYNTEGYRLYRDAYISELAGEPHRFSGTNLKANDLRRIRDGFDKNRQLSYIGLFAMHLVQTAEAFVDCHLKTFDVSDDLSLKIRPTVGTVGHEGGSYYGIGLSLHFADQGYRSHGKPPLF